MAKLQNVVLPLLIFSFFSRAAYYLTNQVVVQAGIGPKLSLLCSSNAAPYPYRLAYTNNPWLDNLLCNLGVCFHTTIDTANVPFCATLFPVVGVVALIPFLEAARDHRPFALSMPIAVLTGVLFQIFTMAVIFPIYALLYVVTGTASATLPSKINQANAEALLFGLIIGYVLPTSFMFLFDQPYPTAVWQGFPLLIALGILAHRVIRPPSRYVQSGHSTVMATLASAFIASTLLHVVYVWPTLTDTDTLRTQFLPIIGPLDSAAISLADSIIDFLKWDLIFGTAAVILSTFWMADNLFTLGKILAWYGVASIALGPAAAAIGVLLWRERRLGGRRQTVNAIRKME